jgi:hypothetical protein
MKRSDIHAPSKINPEDYEFIAALVFNHSIDGCAYLMQQREALDNHMRATGGKYSTHEHGGNCHICGAYMIHTAVFYHRKTNTYIRTGFDCAAKIDMGDRNIFKRCKTEWEAVRKAKAGIKKARGLLDENGLLEFTDSLYDKGFFNGSLLHVYQDKTAHIQLKNLIGTFSDIIEKLSRYGSLTDKQWKFLDTLRGKITNFEADTKAKEEARKHIPDAPEGRHMIAGTVVSIKEQVWDDGYNSSSTWKMLVLANEGFKVWSTIPAAILNTVECGDKVSLNVTLERSNDDPKFAYGSRPAKAKVIK